MKAATADRQTAGATAQSADNSVKRVPSSDAVSQELEKLQDELTKAQGLVTAAQEGERRALADYQNLVRRTQEAQQRMAKLASWTVLQRLVRPFEHLYLAKEQLKDRGLDMVFQQFEQALEEEGLKEIACLGKEVDPAIMEVVDRQTVTDPAQVDKVQKVMQRGYTLHGEVVVPAKVVIGTK